MNKFQLIYFLIFFSWIELIISLPTCNLPPDFWCDHPNIALQCTGSIDYCERFINNSFFYFSFRYRSNRFGKKLELKLAFESACPDSQQFVVYRLYPRLLNLPFYNEMVNFTPIPWGMAKRGNGKF